MTLRRTKNLRTAVFRVGDILYPHGVIVSPVGARWEIIYRGDPVTKTTAPALAHLVEIANHLGVDLGAVRWYGKVPTRGLSAWQSQVLEAFRMEV